MRLLKNKHVIFFLLILLSFQIRAHSVLKGQLYLDSTWAPTVYLSLIPDLDNIYSMSNNMIIENAELKDNGEFIFNIDYLTDEDKLYRIHLSKKGDPPASLIIGGKDENHLFFIANNQSSIEIKNNPATNLISDAAISGYLPNETLQEINRLVLYIDTADFSGSSIKRELMNTALSEKLKEIADTTSHPIVALYALYKSKYEYDLEENPQYYQRFLEKWESNRSGYFNEFRKSIPNNNYHKKHYNLLFILLGFITGIFLTILFFQYKKKRKSLLNNLTNQERKILKYLKNGNSNKEISEELNIEISTVKSHINSIYSKLKINSRKDVMNMFD
ncbi:MAG: LuxR family transcriptional regulator [Prolixibacteraceae bacterium]|nr:LuxR family transcriptional regulator [Prolixibacteraceae bacterium]MBN2772974.1 LuxR family transcriptional regulator [Prolixibacteraceae bacterium]